MRVRRALTTRTRIPASASAAPGVHRRAAPRSSVWWESSSGSTQRIAGRASSARSLPRRSQRFTPAATRHPGRLSSCHTLLDEILICGTATPTGPPELNFFVTLTTTGAYPQAHAPPPESGGGACFDSPRADADLSRHFILTISPRRRLPLPWNVPMLNLSSTWVRVTTPTS